MNRTELIIGMAVILFFAFALGWLAHWMLQRFTRVSGADTGELERLAQALHEAEETRDEAISYLQERESELSTRIAQLQAEQRATMEALRNSRAEVEHLRTQMGHRG